MVLDVVASALTVAEVALKFYHHLSKFAEGTKKAGDVSKNLRSKCKLLLHTLQVVEITFNESQARWKSERPYAFEGKIWANVRESLRSGQRTLKAFQRDLKSELAKSKEGQELGWIAKALLQLKLQSKEGTMTQFERDIDSHMHILEVSMLCINTQNMSTLARNAPLLNSAIHSAEAFVNSTSSIGPPRYSVSERDHQVARASVQKSIDIGKAVSTEKNLSIYAEPEVIVPPDSDGQTTHIRDLERVVSSKSELESDISESDLIFDSLVTVPELADGDSHDPDPNFDDRLPSTLLRAMWMKYCKNIESLIGAHDYSLAEDYQRQLSAFLEDTPEMASEWRKSQNSLAYICEKQDRGDEAKAILLKLARRLSNPVSAPSTEGENLQYLEWTAKGMGEYAKVYYRLAEIQFRDQDNDHRSNINYDPEKFIKRSVKLRWRIHAQHDSIDLRTDQDLVDSLRLMAEIWRSQDKRPAVDTLNTLCHCLPKSASTLSLDELALSLQDYERECRETISSDSPALDHSTLARSPHSPVTDLYINRFLNGYTPLIIAIKDRDVAKVHKKIFKGADVEMSSEEGKSPLLYAIESQMESIVRALVENGATVNVLCGGTTPLHHAVGLADPLMVSLLLELGADPEYQSASGTTSLFYAVGRPSPAVVKVLLLGKADATALHGEEKKTPLHRAVDTNNIGTAKVLIDHASDNVLEAKDLRGRTPFDCAVYHERYELVQLFLDSGVIVDKKTVSRLPQSQVKGLLKRYLKKQPNLISDAQSTVTSSGITEMSDDTQTTSRTSLSSRFSIR